MRALALIVRAGAVVVLTGFVFSLLVRGPAQPVSDANGVEVVARPSASRPPRPVPTKPSTPVPITIAAAGDIGLPSAGATWEAPLFGEVQTDLAGDVVVASLDGALSAGGASRCAPGETDCRPRRAPPAYANRLADAGFTVLSLASDHAFDYGATGIRQTADALGAAGVGHAGRRGQVTVQRVASTDVALVGFAAHPWAASLTDLPTARQLVGRAARTADVVVVVMHGMSDGGGRTRRLDLARFSHAAVDAGADLVVGVGSSELGGMEWYKGRLIAYSLGRLGGYDTSRGDRSPSIGAILRVTLSSDGSFQTGRLVPTRIAGAGAPGLDPEEAAHEIVRRLSRRDFGERGVDVSPDGILSR